MMFRKIVLTAILISLTLWNLPVSALPSTGFLPALISQAEAAAAKSPQVKITGSWAFQKRVREALKLLRTKDPLAYQRVNKYLAKIVEARHSGVDVYTKTFYLGQGTVQASDSYWLAGVIVHDAYHAQLYAMGRPFTGAAAEAACNRRQQATLKALGAPDYYLSYLEEVTKSAYWQVPFEQRNW